MPTYGFVVRIKDDSSYAAKEALERVLLHLDADVWSQVEVPPIEEVRRVRRPA